MKNQLVDFMLSGIDISKAPYGCVAWLKSLKDKVQPKQEWSKDEKRKLDRIYSILRQAADTDAFSTSRRLIGDKECIELQDFLKSIKDRYTWKPSDEQMKAFESINSLTILTCNKQ